MKLHSSSQSVVSQPSFQETINYGIYFSRIIRYDAVSRWRITTTRSITAPRLRFPGSYWCQLLSCLYCSDSVFCRLSMSFSVSRSPFGIQINFPLTMIDTFLILILLVRCVMFLLNYKCCGLDQFLVWPLQFYYDHFYVRLCKGLFSNFLKLNSTVKKIVNCNIACYFIFLAQKPPWAWKFKIIFQNFYSAAFLFFTSYLWYFFMTKHS